MIFKKFFNGYEKLTLILGYWILVFLILYLLDVYFFRNLLDSSHFLHYDAEHYSSIKQLGYHDFRVVFFPLFPKLWGLLGLSVYGISFFNGIIYITSLFFLARIFTINRSELLLILTIPCSIFYFLPYSEAVFFASSSILLIGIKKDQLTWILIGLFFATLSRPAYVVFLPAFFILELIDQKSLAHKLKRISIYLFVCAVATLLVGIIQHADSGMWFNFFKEQKLWGNTFQMPTLPLRSWAGGFITRLDGVALLLGFACIVACFYYVIQFIKKKKENLPPKEVLFSLLYISGISISVLFFRGGSLFSLNRFVFATPFIIIIINYLYTVEIKYIWKWLWLLFFGILAYWLLFNSFVHIQAFLKFLILTFYLLFLVYIVATKKGIRSPLFWIYFLISFELQIYLFVRFFSNDWVA